MNKGNSRNEMKENRLPFYFDANEYVHRVKILCVGLVHLICFLRLVKLLVKS